MRALASLQQDLRYAARLARKTPASSLIIIATLGLSIGAMTTVFSLVDAVILKPLPVSAPDELVYLSKPGFSYPIFREVRERGANVFAGVFAWELRVLSVGWNVEERHPTSVLVASGGFHSTLGVRPVVGRTITPADEGTSAADARTVAVISHRAWQSRFGGDRGVIGRVIHVERTPFTIVGVAPPEFFGVAVGTAPDVTIPVTTIPLVRGEEGDVLEAPDRAWLHIMARLTPGLTPRQADAAFQVIWPRVLEATASPSQPPDRRARYLSRTTELVSGARGFSPVRNQFEEPLLLLFGLVGLMVAVACAAVSGILLARAGARQREIAVRLAIGASRMALVRQVLVEGLLLATFAGLLGLLLSTWAADALVGLLSTRHEPVAVSFTIDWRTLAFTTALSCITVVAFSVAPAAVAAQVDPGPTLKLSSYQPAARRVGRSGSIFVIAQVAFSLLLLVAAALFLRSLVRLLTLDAGFARDNVLVVSTDLLSSGDRAEAPADRAARVGAAYRELLNKLSREPGVVSASLSWVPPISHDLGSWTQSVGIDGAPPLEDGTGYTYFNAVSPHYFETVGTSFVAGRDFRWTDDRTTPRVAIVNESLARAFFPGQTPLGRQISVGRHAGRRNLEIVGVVRDARYQSLQEPTRRIAYLPYLQSPELLEGSNLVTEVRSVANAAGLVRRVGDVVRTVDPSVPVHIETMGDRIRDSLVRERAIALIGTFLALLSLVVAAGALHGLMTDHVARRTNEIGIRLALGARPREIARLVLEETGGLVTAGIVVGLLLAWIGSGIASRFLVGIGPGDPLAVASAVGVVIVVSLVAGALPARRAARVDPLVALRME